MSNVKVVGVCHHKEREGNIMEKYLERAHFYQEIYLFYFGNQSLLLLCH